VKSKGPPPTRHVRYLPRVWLRERDINQETESAVRFALDFLKVLEPMRDGIATFGGWALRDLVRYHKRCRDGLVSCLESLLDSRLSAFGYLGRLS
jgi:hypothetical protein